MHAGRMSLLEAVLRLCAESAPRPWYPRAFAAEGGVDGQMPMLLGEFASGLAALYHDLGDRRKKVTVITMSEFGRRAYENGSHGTDHGHAVQDERLALQVLTAVVGDRFGYHVLPQSPAVVRRPRPELAVAGQHPDGAG